MTDTVTLLDVMRAGTMEVLTIDDLNVDSSYQRDLDHGLVGRIARDYDMAAAGTILVSRRDDGSMWIVNGQHRAMGAKQAGEAEIIAQVVTGLNREQEAKLRLQTNVRRGDTAAERFKAQVASGDPQSLAIVALLEQFDSRINYTPNEHTGINAISAIERLYQVDDGVMLTRVLEVINDSFDKVGGKMVNVGVLKSIHWFLDRHVNEYNRERLCDRIRATGFDEWDRKARSHKAAQGGATWLNYYRALVEMYNHRLPDHKKLLWKLSGSLKTLGDDYSPPGDRGEREPSYRG